MYTGDEDGLTIAIRIARAAESRSLRERLGTTRITRRRGASQYQQGFDAAKFAIVNALEDEQKRRWEAKLIK